jgi:hypothetical protein
MRGHGALKTRVNALERAGDPRIHLFRKMDCRVKPGNDEERRSKKNGIRSNPTARTPCYACEPRARPSLLLPSPLRGRGQRPRINKLRWVRGLCPQRHPLAPSPGEFAARLSLPSPTEGEGTVTRSVLAASHVLARSDAVRLMRLLPDYCFSSAAGCMR